MTTTKPHLHVWCTALTVCHRMKRWSSRQGASFVDPVVLWISPKSLNKSLTFFFFLHPKTEGLEQYMQNMKYLPKIYVNEINLFSLAAPWTGQKTAVWIFTKFGGHLMVIWLKIKAAWNVHFGGLVASQKVSTAKWLRVSRLISKSKGQTIQITGVD